MSQPTLLPDNVVSAWQALSRQYGVWRFFAVESFLSRSSWLFMGVDLIKPILISGLLNKARDIIDPLSDEDFDMLLSLAELNGERQDRAARVIIIQFVSVPLTLFLAWSAYDLASLKSWVSDQSLTEILMLAAIFLGTAALFMASSWQARRLLHVLKLIALARRYPTSHDKGST